MTGGPFDPEKNHLDHKVLFAHQANLHANGEPENSSPCKLAALLTAAFSGVLQSFRLFTRKSESSLKSSQALVVWHFKDL